MHTSSASCCIAGSVLSIQAAPALLVKLYTAGLSTRQMKASCWLQCVSDQPQARRYAWL